jgi:hypothetical protein
VSGVKVKQRVSAEAALKTLEAALEEEWKDAETEANTAESLPLELRDAVACLEWGRAVLAAGLRFPTVTTEASRSDDEEYRMAARNGGDIPLAIQERMHAERYAAEERLTLDIDVEE